MRSVTLIENALGKGQPGGTGVEKRVTKRAQHCLHSFRRKLGFKPMLEWWLLPWAWTNRREGIIWRKH